MSSLTFDPFVSGILDIVLYNFKFSCSFDDASFQSLLQNIVTLAYLSNKNLLIL